MDEDYNKLIQDVKNNTCTSSYSHTLKGQMDNLSVSDGLVLLHLTLQSVRVFIHSGIYDIQGRMRCLRQAGISCVNFEFGKLLRCEKWGS